MKKLGIVLGLLGVLAASIFAGYELNNRVGGNGAMVKDTVQDKPQKANEIKETEEMPNNIEVKDANWLEQKLEPIIKPLGWLAIIGDESLGLSDYLTKRGENLLETQIARQLFVMENLLQDPQNFSDFKTLVDQKMETYESPTDQMVMVYLPYGHFNQSYEALFNEVFDIKSAKFDEELPEELAQEYVYYDNRRPGLNGVCVEDYEVSESTYDISSESYQAEILLKYSERGSETLGRSQDIARLEYKVNGDRLILKGFCLE